MLYESANPFAEYLEALNKCCDAVKLTAYHTLEAARQAEKAADYTMLTAYYVKESLNDKAK